MRKLSLIIIIIWMSVSLSFNSVPTGKAEAVYPTNLETDIHILINEERSKSVPNFPQLKLHSTLIEIARMHSKYMYDETHFSHIDKNGKGPAERVESNGIKYSIVSENLFWSQNFPEHQIANLAVEDWIKSPGHYENIKSLTSFTGIGVYTQSNIFYITQIFIEASEIDMRSNGIVYENNNLEPLNEPLSEPSFVEKYQLEIFVFVLILIVVLLGKKAESLNRKVYKR